MTNKSLGVQERWETPQQTVLRTFSVTSSASNVHGSPATQAWTDSAFKVPLPDSPWPISVSEGGHSFQWDVTGAIFRRLALLPAAETVADYKSPECHAGLKRASLRMSR